MASPSVVTFLTQLNTLIGADAGITAIVGTMFYNGHLPQNITSFPALLFKVVTDPHIETKDGASSYLKVRVQFTSFAAGIATVEALNEAVKDKFNRLRDTSGTVEIHQAFYEGRTEVVPNFDTNIYQISSDYIFHIK